MKTELVIAGIALFALGAFFVTRPQGAEAVSAGLTQFTETDFKAFDRDFEIQGSKCVVGLKRDRICFATAPLERQLVTGMILPDDVPVLGAEFRVIVATDLKAENLRTVRFGRTLALIDAETRRVEDVLRLTADDFTAARSPQPI